MSREPGPLPRKLTVKDRGEWQYHVGSYKTKLRTPKNKDHIIANHALLGMEAHDYVNARNRGEKFAITPKHIADFITKSDWGY